jgi:hypothetical protein
MNLVERNEHTRVNSVIRKDPVVAGNCRGEMAAFRVADGAPQWNLKLNGCIRSIGSSASFIDANHPFISVGEHRNEN